MKWESTKWNFLESELLKKVSEVLSKNVYPRSENSACANVTLTNLRDRPTRYILPRAKLGKLQNSFIFRSFKSN